MKLVSVIIPAYNHEKYVKACLESVINQTYQNLEIIIQDDCSTDKTVEEIKKVKDKRIKVVFSKKNQGVVDTLNDLLDMCHGEYIAAIGSDDIWYPTKIEKQVNFLENHPEMGGVFTIADIIDEDGKVYDDESFPASIFKKDNMSQSERMKLFFETGNHLCHPSSMLTKKAIKKVGKFNRAYRQLHDYDYWTRLINHYNIYILNERLIGYRRTRKINKSVSYGSSENIVRHFNEFYNININMILNSKNDIFLEMLGDKTSYTTSIEFLCKKYLFLLKNKNSAYKNVILKDIFDNPKQEEIFKIFEKKFNYTLNDFYIDTGEAIKTCSIRYFKEYRTQENEKNRLIEQNNELCSKNNELSTQLENMSKAIQDIVNSKSWKVTTPLRKINEIFKK